MLLYWSQPELDEMVRKAHVAGHMDDRGTIEVGELADLVVLGTDPEAVEADDPPSVRSR